MIRPLVVLLNSTLLEHPQALHLKRMRGAIWVYLALLARLKSGSDSLEINPEDLDRRMGLPAGAIRSALGHLKKGGYIKTRRTNGLVWVRINHMAALEPAETAVASRLFTTAKLERALGDQGYRIALDAAISTYPDSIIRRALAGALAVPADEIKRSRTALFLYLLKRHAEEPTNHSRS